MKAHVFKFGHLAAAHANKASVIVDVIRSSSLMAQMLGYGVEQIVPAWDADDAIALGGYYRDMGKRVFMTGDYGTGGEKLDLPNNSVAIEERARGLEGSTVIQTSANGIRGTLRAYNASPRSNIYNASWNNWRAVKDYVKERGKDVDVIPMGDFQTQTPDDDLFAYFLAARIDGQNEQDPARYVDLTRKERWFASELDRWGLFGHNTEEVMKRFCEMGKQRTDWRRDLDNLLGYEKNLPVVPVVRWGNGHPIIVNALKE